MSEPKAVLYDTQSEWNTKQAEVMTTLGISSPDKWCEPWQVDNSAHEDFGKHVMLVHTTGPSKCDQLFDASDLTDIQFDWWSD